MFLTEHGSIRSLTSMVRSFQVRLLQSIYIVRLFQKIVSSFQHQISDNTHQTSEIRRRTSDVGQQT